ncbi:MAG: hypothetical protein DRO99_02085 [Candidatus Aenigmatarchaeota archaeon]|nr:MAG: hypothetical protein DRO99_02085 [Candidatus Aenigmarchaeota archaeon]
MVKYGEIIIRSLKFGVQPKRWLPFFVLDSAFFLLFLAMVFTNLGSIIDILMTATTSTTAAFSLAGYAILTFACVAVWGLIKLYIAGAVIHQSVKPREFSKSWSVSKERYLSLVAVSVVVGVLSGAAGMIPWIGFILSIIVSLAFFFVIPAVVVKKLNFDDSLRESYNIFTKKPLQVLAVWVLISLVTLIIMLVFLLPGILFSWSVVAPLIGQMSTTTAISLIMVTMLTNAWVLALCGIVFIIGMAITNAFALSAQANFYKELRKGKLL